MVMKKKEQIRRLKNLKEIKKYNVPMDLIDFTSQIDSTLSYEENKRLILDYVKELAKSQDNIEAVKQEGTREKERNEKEKEEYENLQNLRKEEENARQKMNKSIEEVNRKSDGNLDKYFEPIKNKLRAVVNCEQHLNSMFIYSEGGLGKSTLTLKTLKQEGYEQGRNLAYLSNYTTIVEFVNFLYENRSKVIVMDDIESMWKLGDKVINLLKGALWGVGEKNARIVTYRTTSQKLTAPHQFEFNGKMIFLLNKMPNEEDSLVSALLSRSLVQEINFSYEKKMEILAEFSKIEYCGLNREDRKMVYNYLKENTDKTCKNINSRTLIKMYDLYLTDKKNWKELVSDLVDRDERLVLIEKLINECNTIKEAVGKFKEETGLSRRQFFRLKNKLKGDK